MRGLLRGKVDKLGIFSKALEKEKKVQNIDLATRKSSENDTNGYLEYQNSLIDKTVSDKKRHVFFKKKKKDFQNDDQDQNDISVDEFDVINYSNNFDKNLVTILNPNSFEAEQFRILKSKIFYRNFENAPRSLVVTSATPNEGKSFVTANLAISIAQNLNHHVLIIDCDMRKGSIHKQFGFGDMPGLSEHLSNDNSLSSLFLKTKVSRLSILPAGKRPPNPYELLSSQRMVELFNELKFRYSDRFIIIDSPPPTLTAETTAISNLVDGVLLVVEYGRTPINMVLEMVEMLGKEKVIYIIFNKYNMRLSKYCTYGKYKKYSKYYKCYK